MNSSSNYINYTMKLSIVVLLIATTAGMAAAQPYADCDMNTYYSSLSLAKDRAEMHTLIKNHIVINYPTRLVLQMSGMHLLHSIAMVSCFVCFWYVGVCKSVGCIRIRCMCTISMFIFYFSSIYVCWCID